MKRLSAAAALVVLGTLLYAAPPAVSASSTCVRSGDVMKLSIASGNAVTMKRDGNAFVVKGGGIGDTTCGNAKVTNVNTINVTGTAGTNMLTLDFSGGLFAPGKTAEADPDVSEIELALAFKGGTDRLIVKGTADPDTWSFGSLGADFTGDLDVDATLSGVEDLRVLTLGGEDNLSAMGGPVTGDPYTSKTTLDTGSDNDTVDAGQGVDTVRAGAGDDTIRAAMDGVVDSIGCSTGTDTVVFLEDADTRTECETIQALIESEPNGSLETANTLPATATSFYGDHSLTTDSDYLKITLTESMSVRLEVVEGDDTEVCASDGVDSYLAVYSSFSETALVTDDDGGVGYCSLIDGIGNTSSALNGLPPGTYYVALSSSPLGTGAQTEFVYRLDVTLQPWSPCRTQSALVCALNAE